MFAVDNASLSAPETHILAVTIIAEPGRGEVRTIIDHTPETTRTEDGETRTVATRTFPRRVACPVQAARQLADGARQMWPRAIVTLVNA